MFTESRLVVISVKTDCEKNKDETIVEESDRPGSETAADLTLMKSNSL